MHEMHVARAPQHLKVLIEGQERLKQILFGPKPFVLHNPIFGVFGGHEDVMQMNNYADRELRQYLQKLVQDVSSNSDDVTRVNEQNVVSGQLHEHVKPALLTRLCQQLRQAVEARLQSARRKWI